MTPPPHEREGLKRTLDDNAEDSDLPPAKLSRFEIGDTESDNAWELEKYQADFINKYIGKHFSNREVKEKVTDEFPVPGNIKKVPILDNHYVGHDLGTKAQRWSKKENKFIEINRPKIVANYNAHMGGVDLCDMLLETYRVRQRTIKYYFHIFYYCIGISVVNSWILYRRHIEQ